MNKGLEIWAKKRAKRKTQAMTKKPEQIGIVRFVKIKDTVHRKVNGHFVHPSIVDRYGLQIEHSFYYVQSGKVEKSMINKHGARITRKYETIPDWADSILIERYNEYREKFLREGILKESVAVEVTKDNNEEN